MQGDPTHDLVFRNARVIDPASALDAVGDVAVSAGRIAAMRLCEEARPLAGRREIDAHGQILCPGLVDAHVHVYEYSTPLGVNPDRSCLGRGVTTVIDCGSAGASTFLGLRKYVMERSKTRVFALLNIAMEGLAWSGLAGVGTGGELDNMNQVQVAAAVACVQAHRDVLVGIKIRLTANVADDGKNEREAFARAQEVAAATGLPLMTHHTISSVPHEGSSGCPGALRAGDIYTHMFHGWASSILDPPDAEGAVRVNSAVTDARARGVLFDVGHGAGAFNWKVAEECVRRRFLPDMISTDLHAASVAGPAYDLPTVMTKFLMLGLTVPDIIARTTVAPARAFNLHDRVGSLAIGRDADLTLLSLVDCDVDLEDVHGQTRRCTQRFVPVRVFRAGEECALYPPDIWPNPLAGTPSMLAGALHKDADWRDVEARRGQAQLTAAASSSASARAGGSCCG